MKNYINTLIAICALFFLGTSCNDDAELTTLQTIVFSAPPQASPSTFVLSSSNKYKSVVTVSWPKVVYPVAAPVTYALEFDVPSDTYGNNAWANAIRVVAGEDVLSKSFTGGDMNKMAKELGLPTDVAGEIMVRVQSNMDRAAYSDPITLTVTPYTEAVAFGEIYMPGDYEDWDFETAAALPAIESGVYEGIITFPTNKGLEFKFTIERNWNQFYGADNDGNFVESGAINLSVPAYGTYKITVNLNTLGFTAVPYAWGVVGTATATPEQTAADPLYGWNHSIPMSYDYLQHIWIFTGHLEAGALKFRLNDSWDFNYGANSNAGNTMYLGNTGAYTVITSGEYKVTFAIDPNPATATYTVTPL